MALKDQECVPCRGGVPPLQPAEVAEFKQQLHDDWVVVDNHHLRRVWKQPDFATAWKLLDRAAALCEQHNHHADFELAWGRMSATIWTHKIDGLSESDFVLAAKFDALES